MKYWNGFVSPYSSPMKSSGTYGESSSSAAASLSWSGETSVDSRSPAARLPTWSWFWIATTKRSRGMPVDGAPCRRWRDGA